MLLVKEPVVPLSVVIEFAVVGFCDVLQHKPLAVIILPLSSVTLPPLIAEVPRIAVAAVVAEIIGDPAKAVPPNILVHSIPLYTWSSPLPQLIHHSTNPAAGDEIALLCAKVILGGKNPLVVDFKSNIAEAFAVLPSALIPTDCAVEANVVKIASKISIFFMMVCFI